jgi:peptidyl-prolyl cis-trans isomerase SurA
MSFYRTLRDALRLRFVEAPVAMALCLAPAASLCAQSAQVAPPVVLDRVVAVVNSHAILSSDLREETLLSILEPKESDAGGENPQEALQRLISRTLIRQQIREEDARSTEPTPADVQQRIAEIRKELPICVRENCSTDAGWSEFLNRHGLTQRRVESYVRGRMEILRFIEMRFKQGIQISQQDVEAYYHNTLVPQYQAGQSVPQLSVVAPRIEEILLQQQVNSMFSGWLDSLRNQGEVEVLDPSLEAAGNLSQGGATSP